MLHSVVGLGGGLRFTVTIGNTGDNYGFNDASFGSISPTSYNAVTIRVISNDLSDDVFTVTMNGSLARSFFSGIEIQGTDGSITTLYTVSGGTFTDLTTGSVWQWTTVSDVFTATTPSTRLARIF